MVAYHTGSHPINDLWLKVKVTVTHYSFFLRNYLLISLLCISALFFPIKMKFNKSFRYAFGFGRFVFEFYKMMGDDVIVMVLSLLQAMVHI